MASEYRQIITKEAGGTSVRTFIDGEERRTSWTADKRRPTKRQLVAEREMAIADSRDFMVPR